ncbi:hypothetical protein HMI56_000589 [Coelomomyces lativittatus]|nr:hypothetical protein HMI56_000589 [Coelomomyces lativittatus]
MNPKKKKSKALKEEGGKINKNTNDLYKMKNVESRTVNSALPNTNTNTSQTTPPIPTPIDWSDHQVTLQALYDELYTEEGNSKKSKNFYIKNFPEFPIDAICVHHHAFLNSNVPTHARTLFLQSPTSGKDPFKIFIRGYDKFFNLGEVKKTVLSTLMERNEPFDVTVKENGCFIAMSSLDSDTLLIASKSSIKSKHCTQAKEWVLKHLASVNSSEKDFANYLYRFQLTAVGELIDETFEEHVLEYPTSAFGLWIHGFNYNTVRFSTLPYQEVVEIARYFGFHVASLLSFPTFEKAYNFTKNHPKHENRDIEGYVIRSVHPPLLFVKIKIDRPYLMYREWREITNHVLKKNVVDKFKFPESKLFYTWVLKKYQTDPTFFDGHLQFQGIYKVRRLFLKEIGDLSSKISQLTQPSLPKKLKSNSEHSISCPTKPSFSKDRTGLPSHVLIVPMGTVGIGKSTLGRALHFCLGFAHVQSDLISRRKSKAKAFTRAVLQAFLHHAWVYADRNHPNATTREKFVYDIKDMYPGVCVIYIDWNLHELSMEKAIQFSKARILKRGENHPTLTPKKTKHFEKVITQFLYARRKLTSNELRAGTLIRLYINMSKKHMILHAFKEIHHLTGIPLCSDAKLSAFFSKLEELEKSPPNLYNSRSALPSTPSTAKTKKPPVTYYAIALSPIPDPPSDFLPDSYVRTENRHCTLFHQALLLHSPELSKKVRNKELRKIHQAYQSILNQRVSLTIMEVRMNAKCSAYSVQFKHFPLELQPKYPHITLAVAPGSKPKDAIELFMDSEENQVHKLAIEPFEVSGFVTGY